MVVMSLDVKALYQSLRIKEAATIMEEYIYDVLMSEKLKVESVDWHEVGKYIAVVMPTDEQERLRIRGVVPRRNVLGPGGPKPTAAYWESDVLCRPGKRTAEGQPVKVNKWIRVPEPSKRQGCRMIAKMLVKAVEVSMTNHMYRFDGRFYHRKDGGPIGDELSQTVARMVMCWFDNRMLAL